MWTSTLANIIWWRCFPSSSTYFFRIIFKYEMTVITCTHIWIFNFTWLIYMYFFSGTMYWILIYSLYNNLNYCVVIFLALFLAIQYHHKTFRIFYYICEELRVCYTFSFLRMVLMIPGEFIHFVKGIILLFDSIHRATLGSKYCSGWKDKTTEMPGFGWLIQIGETQFNKSASHHCFSIVL